eukprot:gene9192-6469_t
MNSISFHFTDPSICAAIAEGLQRALSELQASSLFQTISTALTYEKLFFCVSSKHITVFSSTMAKFIGSLVAGLLLLSTMAVCLAAADPGDPIPGVVELTDNTFDQVVGPESGKYVFVEFYANWCGHCKKFVSEYTTLAAAYAKAGSDVTSKLTLAKVDALSNEALAKRFDVNSFPSIFFFAPGAEKPEKYRGGREAHVVAEFLTTNIPGMPLLVKEPTEDALAYVPTLTATTFRTEVMDPNKEAVVFFYAPWCHHCKMFKPVYSAFAELFVNDKDHIVVARLDATKTANRELAEKYKVRSFPTVLVFPRGENKEPIPFSGPRSVSGLLGFVNQHISCPRLLNGEISWKCGVYDDVTALLSTYVYDDSETKREEALKKLTAITSTRKEFGVSVYKEALDMLSVASDAPDALITKVFEIEQNVLPSLEKGPERDHMLIMLNILRSAVDITKEKAKKRVSKNAHYSTVSCIFRGVISSTSRFQSQRNLPKGTNRCVCLAIAISQNEPQNRAAGHNIMLMRMELKGKFNKNSSTSTVFSLLSSSTGSPPPEAGGYPTHRQRDSGATRKCDVKGLELLMRASQICREGIPPAQVFKVTKADDFIHIIETSVLCLTALSTIKEDLVIGFIALSDSPGHQKHANRWCEMLHGGAYSAQHLHLCQPYSTLWLQTIIAPPTSTLMTGISKAEDAELYQKEMDMEQSSYTSQRLAQELLTVALGTSPTIEFILSVVPHNIPFDLMGQIAQQIPLSASAGKGESELPHFAGDLLCIKRVTYIPKLSLRLGRIQDYDDFVPLLVRGRGVITALPQDFFLEEQLKEQDDVNKICIAENPVTHQVVGLACLRALGENQEHLNKRYITDVYGKLRSLGMSEEVAEAKKSSDNKKMGNTFMIDFLYVNPDYDKSVHDFLPFMFKQFPMCEYAAIILPHDIEEPNFLSDFIYLPIHHYQPHNFKGESIAVPEGLWVSCRYSLDPLSVHPVKDLEQQNAVDAFLNAPMHELTNEIALHIREDLFTSLEVEKGKSVSRGQLVSNTAGFTLKWCDDIVGAATARRLSLRDMYALRHNYDMDNYVYYYARTHKNYETTDISLTPQKGKEKFFSAEMPGIIIRAMYVKPQFQHGLSFFIREMLRLYNVEMAVVLGKLEDEPFRPLVPELLPVRPRRVLESPVEEAEENSATNDSASVSGRQTASMSLLSNSLSSVMMESVRLGKKSEFSNKDPGALGSLFFTTRRALGDKKKRVNTRVAVVGAGVTGLAFLQRLLAVPYIHFTNLFLISTDGLPFHHNQMELAWFADNMELMEREHLSLMVGNPIRVVSGTMIDLDKTNKFIAVDNRSFEPYDYLILTCGRQYISPLSVRTLQQQEGRPLRAGMLPMTGESAVFELQSKLQEIDSNPNNTDNILVYGGNLDAFSTVSAIIKFGFSSQRIVMCSPSVTNPFVDEQCYSAVVTLLKSMGTSVMRGFDVSRLEYDDDNNLTTVMLAPVSKEGSTGTVELRCCYMICMEDKDIDPNILSTLNKRSIVFDGRVIVENNYRTTDPYVFAAGPVAMFTRRYGATQNFDDFKARDIGSHLADVLLGFLGFDEFFDPKYHAGNEFSLGIQVDGVTTSLYTKLLEENGSKLASQLGSTGDGERHFDEKKALDALHHLPTYTTPLARRLRFPGGYQFFCAHRVNFNPDECFKLDCSNLDFNNLYNALQSNREDESDAEEQQPSVEQNYIAIYINNDQRVIDGVTFFGNGKPEVHNYYALIGYPETILNLVFRYNEGAELAKKRNQSTFPGTGHLTAGVLNGKLNLMEYLRLPHLQTVFYDKFVEFFGELRERMKSQQEAIKMRERILSEHSMDLDLTAEQIAAYQVSLTKMKNSFRYEVQLELIRFLHENKDFRPQNIKWRKSFLCSTKPVSQLPSHSIWTTGREWQRKQILGPLHEGEGTAAHCGTLPPQKKKREGNGIDLFAAWAHQVYFHTTTHLCYAPTFSHTRSPTSLSDRSPLSLASFKVFATLVVTASFAFNLRRIMFRFTVPALKKLTPLGQRVLVKRTAAAKQTKAGILIPEQVAGKINEGTIVAVAAGTKDWTPATKVNDTVLLPEYGGFSVKVDGEEFFLYEESMLLGFRSGNQLTSTASLNISQYPNAYCTQRQVIIHIIEKCPIGRSNDLHEPANKRCTRHLCQYSVISVFALPVRGCSTYCVASVFVLPSSHSFFFLSYFYQIVLKKDPY